MVEMVRQGRSRITRFPANRRQSSVNDATVPEAVLATTRRGEKLPALCYNLLVPPKPSERNRDYAVRLQRVLRALDFPLEYIDSVA